MRTLRGGAGSSSALVLALGAVVFCFWPIGGPLRRGVAADRRPPRGPARSRTARPASRLRRRPEFSSATGGRPEPVVATARRGDATSSCSPRRSRASTVGVIKDRRARTYTAALAVKVTSFGLLDRAEQESRQAGWGGVLAGLAREGAPVSRIQWIERTVPADGDEIGRYLGEAWDRDAVAARLAADAVVPRPRRAPRPPITTDHELFVCLQIDAKRAWRQIKRAGGKQGADAGACACPAARARGARRAARRRRRPGRRRAPARDARDARFRVAFDPWSRPGLARLAAADPERDGIDEGAAWPVGAETSWSSLPDRRRVPRDLLDRGLAAHRRRRRLPLALLLHAQMVRAIAVTIEPISPLQGDPRGRGRADERRRRPRPPRPHGLHRDRATAAAHRSGRAPRGGTRRRARRGPLRRLRHRLRAHRSRSSSATAPRSSTPRRWRGSSCSASTASRRRRSPTRCRSAGGCGEHEGPARPPRDDGARPGRVPVRRRGRPRRTRRLHRPRRLRRLVLLRPVGALRQGADEPERRRDRHRRPREVEPRQDLRLPAGGLRPAGVDRRRQGRVRPARGGARRPARSRSRRAARSGSTRSRRAAGRSGSSTSSTPSPPPRSSGR